MLGQARAVIMNQPKSLAMTLPLILIGLAGSILAITRLSHLPTDETKRANMQIQRVVIDAATGEVAGLRPKERVGFDVGEPAKPPAPHPQEEAAPSPEEAPALPAASASHHPEATAEGSSLRTEPLQTDYPQLQRSGHSLVKAPAPEAIEHKDELILPRKTDKGLMPARLYARSFARVDGQKLLAILLTDVGYNSFGVASAVALPHDVSVAVSPYATGSNAIIETIRNAGHEAWVMLPAMTDAYPAADPGPLGLVATQKPEGAVARVQQVLAAAIGTVGVVLDAEEAITPNAAVWNPAFTEIEGRGLYGLSARPDRSLDQLSPDKEKQAVLRRADLVIDDRMSATTIRSKLASLESLANTKDEVILVVNATPQTLEILKGWLNAQQLFTLAPLSAIYRGVEKPPEPVEVKKKSGGH